MRLPTLPIISQRGELLKVPFIEGFPDSRSLILFNEATHPEEPRDGGCTEGRLSLYFYQGSKVPLVG